MPRQNSIQHYLRSRHDSLLSRLSRHTSKPSLELIDSAQPPANSTLLILPNEILLQIAGHLRSEMPRMLKEERFDGIERIEFVKGSRNLIRLSRTCRRLRPVAQEALLHTAVLGGFDGLPAFVSLTRVLIENPTLGKHVRKLRIGLPPNDQYYFKTPFGSDNRTLFTRSYGSPPSDIWLRAAELIVATPLSEELKTSWRMHLMYNYSRPICGVLLALLPNLEYLSISHSLGFRSATDNRTLKKMFGIATDECNYDLSPLPAFVGLRYFNDSTPLTVAPRLSDTH